MSKQNHLKKISIHVAVLLLYVVLGYFYLSPGPQILVTNSTTQVMSDGTDPATLPFQYQVVIDTFHKKASELFFGAVPTELMDVPDNYALWVPWIERWSAIFWSHFFVTEQISTAVTWELVVLSGFLFYVMAMAMNWGLPLSAGGGLAFAFCAYVRARAKVHMALTGIYFLPAIFLALHLLRGKPDKWKFSGAAILFLLASMTAHYYLILAAALSPFFALYFFSDAHVRGDWKAATLRLVAASLPAVTFVGWCFIKPIPSSYISSQTSVVPQALQQVDDFGFHPFMTIFASRAVDYLGGDTAISNRDWNPLRAKITSHIHSDLGAGNPHERTNGIRWLVLMAFAVAIGHRFFTRRQTSERKHENHDFLFFVLLAAVGFLVSLQPVWFDLPIGPSGFIHRLVPQFRVPSRAGILVNFAVLCAVGTYLSAWGKNQARRRKLFWLAPALVFAEYSPMTLAPMPTAPVFAAIQAEPCGRGLYLPYVSSTFQMLNDYYLLQQLRGTKCQIFNATSSNELDIAMIKRLPLSEQTVGLLKANDQRLKSKMVDFARCAGIDWIFFDYNAPDAFVTGVCSQMGWVRRSPQFCSAQQPLGSATKERVIGCSEKLAD